MSASATKVFSRSSIWLARGTVRAQDRGSHRTGTLADEELYDADCDTRGNDATIGRYPGSLGVHEASFHARPDLVSARPVGGIPLIRGRHVGAPRRHPSDRICVGARVGRSLPEATDSPGADRGLHASHLGGPLP